MSKAFKVSVQHYNGCGQWDIRSPRHQCYLQVSEIQLETLDILEVSFSAFLPWI
jgi:hypothetical protein